MSIYQKLAAFIMCGFAASGVYAGEEKIKCLPDPLQEYCQFHSNQCEKLLTLMKDKINCANGAVQKEALKVAKAADYKGSQAVRLANDTALNTVLGKKQY